MALRSGRKLSPKARQGISGMVLIYPAWMTHVLFLVQRKSSQAAVVTEVGDAKKDQKAGSLAALVFWRFDCAVRARIKQHEGGE